MPPVYPAHDSRNVDVGHGVPTPKFSVRQPRFAESSNFQHLRFRHFGSKVCLTARRINYFPTLGDHVPNVIQIATSEQMDRAKA